jgi:UDP-N-acetylmuramate dehydrogenase
MIAERNVPLQSCNSFGIVARAQTLVRVRQPADVQAVLDDPELGPAPKFVLGGGSNIVLTGDVRPVVLKVELTGRRLVADTPRPGSWRPALARTGTTSWPGRWSRAGPGWRTWR